MHDIGCVSLYIQDVKKENTLGSCAPCGVFYKRSLKTTNSHCHTLVLRIFICDENVNRVQ